MCAVNVTFMFTFLRFNGVNGVHAQINKRRPASQWVDVGPTHTHTRTHTHTHGRGAGKRESFRYPRSCYCLKRVLHGGVDQISRQR